MFPCEQLIIWGLHYTGMWHHITKWLVFDIFREFGGLIFQGSQNIDPKDESNMFLQHHAPIMQWIDNTYQKKKDLNCINAEA